MVQDAPGVVLDAPGWVRMHWSGSVCTRVVQDTLGWFGIHWGGGVQDAVGWFSMYWDDEGNGSLRLSGQPVKGASPGQ